MHVVKEFMDVFQKKIHGLSHAREVEFSIDLMHGIGLVSITSYRINLVEFVAYE